ncbi:HIRAN domain-containing protein [Sphingomonas naphthae]|uniref:HIRAN domain-containing protein n=1 Tax=Sphingomonas naphthae TaxID=1813468 RepID=A0ABY7TPA9_9SPHN|nr:HIRAN domain-containing protein [Sphingomonas naphthae]WCT75064.1 HIRAN domain-containing protein [Sphingomonas naphthae]
MGWIEFTLPATGRLGKRRKAAAIKDAQAAAQGRRICHAPPSPAGVRLNVVGGFYDNEDGTSRQKETRKLRPGDPVQLRREPENRFDPSAVGVYPAAGVRIGYIGEQRTAWIGSKIDRGMVTGATVERIIGKVREGNLKPVLRIEIEP